MVTWPNFPDLRLGTFHYVSTIAPSHLSVYSPTAQLKSLRSRQICSNFYHLLSWNPINSCVELQPSQSSPCPFILSWDFTSTELANKCSLKAYWTLQSSYAIPETINRRVSCRRKIWYHFLPDGGSPSRSTTSIAYSDACPVLLFTHHHSLKTAQIPPQPISRSSPSFSHSSPLFQIILAPFLATSSLHSDHQSKSIWGYLQSRVDEAPPVEFSTNRQMSIFPNFCHFSSPAALPYLRRPPMSNVDGP